MEKHLYPWYWYMYCEMNLVYTFTKPYYILLLKGNVINMVNVFLYASVLQ